MTTTNNPIRIRLAAALVGLGLGVNLAVAGLAAGGIFLAARAARADVTPECMMEAECINKTKAKGGNCDDQHCFDKGHSCKNGGGWCYAKWAPAKLTIDLGSGTKSALDIGDYLVKLYNYASGVAAMLAAVMMIAGGFYYLTSAGNQERVKKGKTMIVNAVIGLLLVMGAYVILQTINPDLLRFRLPKVPVVKRQFLLTCRKYQICRACGVPFYVKMPKGEGASAATGGAGTADCKKYVIDDPAKMSDADRANYDISSICYGSNCQGDPPVGISNVCFNATSKCVKQSTTDDKPGANCVPGAAGGASSAAEYACRLQKQAYEAAKAGGDAGAIDYNKQIYFKCLTDKAISPGLTVVPTSGGSTGPTGPTIPGLPTGTTTLPGSGKPCTSDADCDTTCEACATFTSPRMCLTKAGAPASCKKMTPSGGGAGGGGTTPAISPDGITGGYYCKSCVADGQECANDDQCCGGKCVGWSSSINTGGIAGTHVCSSGAFGSKCASDQDCTTGFCNTAISGGMCTTGAAGSPCNNGKECVSKVCTDGVCVGGGLYNKCDNDGQCPGAKCDSAMKVCVPPGGAQSCGSGGTCPAGMVCNTATEDCTNYLVMKTCSGRPICMPSTPGAPCKTDKDCFSGGTLSPGMARGCAHGICTSGELGAVCDKSMASPCNSPGICACFGTIMKDCYCMTGTAGSPCEDGKQCTSGFECVTTGGSKGTCQQKFFSGSPTP